MASKPTIPRKCHVFGRGQHYFFDLLKMGGGFFSSPEISRRTCDFLREEIFLRALAHCVLGAWPWPRAFLSLASKGSVIGKSVLGLGFFCVLGLCIEPCVLDSTSTLSTNYFPSFASDNRWQKVLGIQLKIYYCVVSFRTLSNCASCQRI